MVIYETDQAYIMTTQHDHAHISGELASQWEESAFKNRRHKQDFVYAAREHDRGWIQLDAAPFWNDHVSAPYTFIDFPLSPRFVFYHLGIDEVEQGNTYAALLCSLMYKELVGRTEHQNAQDKQITHVYQEAEEQRRQRLKQELACGVTFEHQVRTDVRRMLFCDELSLFLCSREPGTPAADYEWFADGLSFPAVRHESGRVRAEWLSDQTVGLSFFPFKGKVEITHTFKKVDKEKIRTFGLLEAYRSSEWKHRTFTIEHIMEIEEHKENA
ncbi:serine hydroxymethyltransferase [Paenibacillus sp. IHB B 3084]|uniref:DUF3891 family protein n=1 Tax=unclassified Paenibacillus TaxID=185978 RepID=UPI00071EF075|nr:MULTISPECIES: DUF3891 family protein [unclassified Paenibacillus]ALP34881.1 serine hydroxymethyltransferase [Paenibacillus sp. IHB B 3084]MBE0335251.1 DUF3891 family protein [Paenibacillus sp. 23TSA30-6]